MRNKKLRYCLYLIIAVGVISHIMPYVFQRSLWIDEARLASSIVNRDFLQLAASPLDTGQSAPVGYLYLVKFLCTMFGTGEAALRLWSLLAFFGSAFVFGQILSRVIKAKYRLIYLAVFMVIPIWIYYGNELKPYMSECFFVLLAVFLYGMYQDGRLGFGQIAAAYAAMVWCSFGAVFYIAGAMILISVEMLFQLIKEKRGRTNVLKKIPFCFLVLFSFLLNYVFWLSSTSSNAEGQGYWELLRFPLIPTSFSDIRLMGKMMEQVLMPFGSFRIVICLLVTGKVILCIRRRSIRAADRQILSGTALLLMASWLGFYPIQDRMVLFVSMTLLVFVIDVLEDIIDLCLKSGKKLVVLALLGGGGAVFLVYLLGDSAYWRPGGVYMVGSETAGNLRYLEEHLTEADMVYVRHEAIPAFLYEMDYPWGDADLVYETPLVKDHYILGQPTFRYFYEIPYSYEGEPIMEAVETEAELIESCDSVYIYTSHEIAEKKEDTQALLRLLERSGEVRIAACEYETYLYHYVKTNSGI